MSAHYYVWYRVPEGVAAEAETAVRALQARLACSSGIGGRLLKKRDAPETWMEVYEGVAEPQAFERQLQELVERYDVEMFLDGGRHVECFVGEADAIRSGVKGDE